MKEYTCTCKNTAEGVFKCKFHQQQDEVRWAQDGSRAQDFDEVSSERLDLD